MTSMTACCSRSLASRTSTVDICYLLPANDAMASCIGTTETDRRLRDIQFPRPDKGIGRLSENPPAGYPTRTAAARKRFGIRGCHLFSELLTRLKIDAVWRSD